MNTEYQIVHANKYNLLPYDSLTVLRRMVRELNSQENGFYTNGHRYKRARLSKGQLQVRATSFDKWQVMGFEQYFSDAYGNKIVCSRTKGGN